MDPETGVASIQIDRARTAGVAVGLVAIDNGGV